MYRHFIVFLVFASSFALADGKLIATPGVTQFEGSSGGGLVVWATLAGYASREEIAVSAFGTNVNVDDFRLDAYGAAVNFYDRLEISAARHSLDVEPLDATVRQDIFGVKFRLYGDIVYSRYPQVSIGVQHKRLKDREIPLLVGARETQDEEYYLAVTDLHLGAFNGYNLLWNLTARYTRSNQAGLLGHGGDRSNSRDLLLEGSVAVLLGRHWVVGYDYRQKPDNLGFADEDDWQDFFVAYIPNKHFNITTAWARLGDIAGQTSQDGLYISLTGYLR